MAGIHSVVDDLVSFALVNGLTRAGVVRAGELVVEERIVTEGCGGCPGYVKNLCCPPYIPPPADFRRELERFELGLVMQLAVSCGHEIPEAEVYKGSQRLHRAVLKAEEWARARGMGPVLGLIGGNCRLCEVCPEPPSGCRDKKQARSSLEANGINVIQLCDQLGWPMDFPVKNQVHWTGLLLIAQRDG